MMDQQFAQLESQYGLPAGLLSAVQQQESGGDANAVSPKGAIGAFQFEPETAQQYGIDPTDPTQAAHGAAMMLSDLSKKYKGDVPSMLAAYNWGQGNLDKQGIENIPSETQKYIQKVTASLPSSDEWEPVNQASNLDEWEPMEENKAPPTVQSQSNFSDDLSPKNILRNTVKDYQNIKNAITDIPSQMASGASDLADLVTMSDDPGFEKAKADFNEKYQKGTATSSDYKNLFLAGENASPGGKFLGATRLFPPFAAGASAFQNVINPALENLAEKIGMDKEDVPIAEQALAFLGGKSLPEKNVMPDSINKVASKVEATGRDVFGRPAILPQGMNKTADSAQPLIVSNNGVREGINAFRSFQDTDGIDLNKTADTLEQMQKTNPDARAIDAMTKTEGDIPTGANIQGLARSIANSPGQGRTMIAQMSGRARQAANRIGTLFDSAISNLPYSKVQSDAIEAREGTSPIYQKAFSANQNMMTPKINQILNRPAGQAALKQAATTMQNDGTLLGVSDPDLVQQAALTGQAPTGIGIASGLKMQTLHYVKQALWDSANSPENFNKFGQRTAAGNAILGQYHDLLSEINSNDATRQPNQPNSGLYAQANQKYSTGARQEAALKQGQQFNTMRPEEITDYLNDKSISNPEKAAWLSGARDKLSSMASPKAPGVNPINTFNKVGLLKNLNAIAGKNSEGLLTAIENEAHMATNDSLLGNSQTAANQAFQASPTTPHTLPARIAGEVPVLGGLIGYGIDKALAKNNAKMSADAKAVVARILTSKNPDELRALSDKQGANNK